VKALRDPREPAAFSLVVLIGFVVAKFIAVAVHEVMGHGVFTDALGGVFYGVYISPGSGFTLLFLPATTPPIASVLVDLAGITVDLLLGVAVFVAYPRVRSFVGRLFALLLLQSLFVYSLAYLALGTIESTGGDSYQAVQDLGAPFLPSAFLAVGILWALGSAYVISRELVVLTSADARFARQLTYLGLFWFVPLASGYVPAIAFGPGSAILYFLLFAAVGAISFAAGWLLALRIPDAGASPKARALGRVIPLAVAFAVVLPIWLGGFGLSDSAAHGILVREAPLEAEGTLSDSQVINVEVDLAADGNVTLEFRMRGVPPATSPLEDAVWNSFNDRADFPSWIAQSRCYARWMFNVTAWDARSASIDANGTIWSGAATVGQPRVVRMGVSNPVDEANLTTVSVNGTRAFLTIAPIDSLRYYPTAPCGLGFFDEMNLTWASSRFRLSSLQTQGGAPASPLIGGNFVRFRNPGPAEDAPTKYRLVLEVF